MAELNKSVLGKVSGSIGELTFRQRNGKNVICMKPSSFTPGSDANSIARRDRFKLNYQTCKRTKQHSLYQRILEFRISC
ncbi:MAG: hypothetical protein IPH62_17860 [Ignavibacteriae bacterium]|nr:hypothetical protein [Ignavibacteriota bacterium]